MKNKEFRAGMIAGALILLLVGNIIPRGISWIKYGRDSVLSDDSHVKKIQDMEELIDAWYLEEADEDALAEGMYAGLIAGLKDPYSRYYTAEEYEEENTVTEGAYVGIGIQMMKNPQGGILIVECYEGGPGQKAGLRVNDLITAVNGTDITDAGADEVASMIKGSEEKSVTLTIYREEMEEPLDILVPIQDVELPSVFHEMLGDRTGYIRITEFSGVTYEQYRTAFEDLREKGMERMVVDLRDNPGGLLDSVCDILEEILPEGIIVYMEDKYGNREEKTCDGENPLEIPLVVLVNENSASASEIFSGAVQDYGIGKIVGVRTYGKGVVQAIRKLEDGSAVKLTVSQYFTPNGRSIHEVGIEPDVEVKRNPELLNREDITHEEDNQLQKALEVLDEMEKF